MTVAVDVVGLSKQYRLGERASYGRLTESLAGAVSRLTGSRARRGERFWALQDVTFSVSEGESFGLIGRNGAGKTTLLRVLSRITKPTRGYADVRGRVGSLLEVGIGFHPELNARENIFLSGAILGMGRAEIRRHLDEIVGFAEVGAFLDTPLKRFSSGMYLRLAFSVAAHLETDILLIDEVLAVGDAAFQKKCLSKMSDATGQGRTVLFVSHNMSAIRSLCTRAALLDGGKVLSVGSSEETIDRYLRDVLGEASVEAQTTDVQRPSSVSADPPLRIDRVAIAAADGRDVLRTGEPMTVELAFHVREPLENVVIAWSVQTGDSVRLFECRSNEGLGTLATLDVGDHVVRAVIAENPLNPGIYTLHVGARREEGGLDYLPDILAFRVEARDVVRSLWLESPSGFLRVPSDWTITAARP